MSTTPTDVGDTVFDVIGRGVGVFFQKFGCCHHKTRLAVAALGNLYFQPCLLHGMQMGFVFRKPLNGGYFFAVGQLGRIRTRAN